MFAINTYSYSSIHHFDTLDQRESVLDISHSTQVSVRYKKFAHLSIAGYFDEIFHELALSNVFAGNFSQIPQSTKRLFILAHGSRLS